MASVSFTLRNGLPTTPITVNGVPITNPTDVRNLIAAETRAIEVANSFRGKPITQESRNANREASAAVISVATVALNNANAGKTPQSAGAQTNNSQRARDDAANTQNPQAGQLTQNANGRVASAQTPPPTNARPANTNTANTGTNAPTRPISQTQAVPAITAQPTLGSIINRPSPGSTAAGWVVNPVNALTNAVIGAFSGGDDAYTNSLRGRINQFAATNKVIKPQPNALAQYYSYTYSISLYIMSPTDYKKMVLDKKHYIPGYQLLMQSGGAPFVNEQNTPPNGAAPSSVGNNPVNNTQAQQTASAGRNQYFPLDYYLDDLRIQHLMLGKGTRGPQPITEMSFKILEPNGLSLLDNLFNAVQAYTGKRQNYLAQNYLMVIRFYGYDQNGNLVRAAGFPDAGNATTTSGAVIEKYIPFQFKNITFKIANKITEYNCTATLVQNAVASGQGRGTIPYNVELTAKTINEVFNSKASFSSTSIFDKLRNLISGGRETQSSNTSSNSSGSGAPPKAGSAPSATLTSGLVDALNTYEREHVEKGIFEVADEYEVIFTDDIIASAEVTPPGGKVKNNTGMNNNSSAAQQLNSNKQSVDVNSKNTSATAGTSIIQFIDQTVRNSRYIYDQQTKIIDPDTQKEKPNGTAAKTFAWYRVGMQAVPIKYDYKRNDYAYKITYQVSPYLVNNLDSEWFPNGQFRGVQKLYNYWFTGENIEVLSYEQEFNGIFYIAANASQREPEEYNYREIERRLYQTRSNASDQGQEGKVNEPGANAADRLYSPSDLSKVKLQILGDPAWMLQGEIWSGVAGSSFKYDAFLPDGTVNNEAGEVLFEVAWNKPVDYNLETGIQDPYQQGNGANSVIGGDGKNKKQTTQSNIYRSQSITNTFSQGKFIQDLEGWLYKLPITKPDKAPPTLAQRLLNTAASGARSLLNNAADNKSTDILSLTVKAGANLIRGAVKGVEYVANRSSANTSAINAENAARSQRTPVPSQGARPPTSNGQSVGPAVTGQSRQPSGGTPTDTVITNTFNENTFRTKDPVAWSQYTQYKQAEYNRIFQLEQASLTRQAQNGVIFNNTVSPRQQAAISAKAAQIATAQSQQNALQTFSKPIISSGAGTSTTTTTPANTAQVNTGSYTINKDF